jgi:2-C-methyl-D-erythritol 2,4-cyclodiphosphate synthase
MRLGGIDIAGDVHCAGHSDGDAICHAITDAILGAAAFGDIGQMFPDTDAANKKAAVTRLWDAGYRVHNVDVTVIAQHPKIGPHREAMRAVLCEALRIPHDQVFVKGKTNEGMGWIGREEGLAVMCTATIHGA